MNKFRKGLFIGLGALLVACGGGGGNSTSPPVASPPPPPPVSTEDTMMFSVLTERTLEADGDTVGLSAYELIRGFGGPNPIESPDLYPQNHPGVLHIYEDTDAVVGNHFVFLSHRDIDRDRDRLDITDRQRNEIKTYNSSEEAVKGFENETFIFKWKFKINGNMEISTRFSHFFQLKAVGGSDSHPVLTITGAERDGQDGIEVRHSPEQDDTILERVNWDRVTGEWVEVYCRVTFADSASLRIVAKRLSDGEVIFNIDQSGLDFWRGTEASHFVRPKWGIYRSLADFDNLRSDEEIVRFASFSISEVIPN